MGNWATEEEQAINTELRGLDLDIPSVTNFIFDSYGWSMSRMFKEVYGPSIQESLNKPNPFFIRLK